MLMNELFDKYDAEYIPELEPRSQRDYRGILVKLRETFGHMTPQEIKPRHVADFINVKKGRIHRNRMVTILSTVYKIAMGSWCIEMDLVNPCTVVKKWPTKPRERYITDAEFAEIRAIACPQVQIAMDLALLTGQRQSDIVGLTWKQIKAIGVARPDWRIEIDQGKTGKKLAIMISPAVETVLKRAKLMEPFWPREHVIRTPNGASPIRLTASGRSGSARFVSGNRSTASPETGRIFMIFGPRAFRTMRAWTTHTCLQGTSISR